MKGKRKQFGLFEPRELTPEAERLLGNFEVLAGAPGGVKRLRELVLELAVRGRLLASSGETQAAEGLGFPIPAGWRCKSGREIFSFVTSGSRGWAQYYSEHGPIFIRIGNLDYESIDLDLRNVQRVQPPANAEGVRTKVEPGDILISITGDTGMVAVVPPKFGEGYINQHIALARPTSEVLSAFVGRMLTAQSLRERLRGAQRGIKNSLGLDDIRNLLIPVPPLAEQKRIVAKVDELIKLCDTLEAKLRSAEEGACKLADALVAELLA